MQGGSDLVFQFKGVSLDGTTGAGTNWDYIDAGAGALQINATAVNPITVHIESLSSLTMIGPAAGFSNASGADADHDSVTPITYQWLFAKNVVLAAS